MQAVEALVRWKHPQKGLLPPEAFLPTAEREGLMHELTAWVMLGREITGRAVDDTGAAAMARSVALDFARALGCVGAQDYGLARPMASRALSRSARERG